MDRNKISDDENGWRGTGTWIDAKTADTARHDKANVALIKSIDCDGLLHRRLELLGGVWDVEPNYLGRVKKAAQVRIAFKDFSGIDANALEHAVAVEKPVIVDADPR